MSEPDPSVPTQNLFLDENLSLIAPPFNSSVPVHQPPWDTECISKPPPILDSDKRALQHLINGAVPQDELAFLIESIVSNVKPATIVEYLRGSDAQAFIEVMDKVCMSPPSPWDLLVVNSSFSGPR